MADSRQQRLADKALSMARAKEQDERPANADTPNEGTVPTPRPDQAPSGALDAEGHRPVLERSRKVR